MPYKVRSNKALRKYRQYFILKLAIFLLKKIIWLHLRLHSLTDVLKPPFYAGFTLRFSFKSHLPQWLKVWETLILLGFPIFYYWDNWLQLVTLFNKSIRVPFHKHLSFYSIHTTSLLILYHILKPLPYYRII